MEGESNELEEYIRSSISAIKKAVGNSGFHISSSIKFNLAVTNTAEGGGGFKIYVAKAEGKLKSEEISHMEFEVRQDIPQNNFRESSPRINPAR